MEGQVEWKECLEDQHRKIEEEEWKECSNRFSPFPGAFWRPELGVKSGSPLMRQHFRPFYSTYRLFFYIPFTSLIAKDHQRVKLFFSINDERYSTILGKDAHPGQQPIIQLNVQKNSDSNFTEYKNLSTKIQLAQRTHSDFLKIESRT